MKQLHPNPSSTGQPCPIRGQSSAEEFLSLLEEGIEVLPLPPLDEEMH